MLRGQGRNNLSPEDIQSGLDALHVISLQSVVLSAQNPWISVTSCMLLQPNATMKRIYTAGYAHSSICCNATVIRMTSPRRLASLRLTASGESSKPT